MTTDEYIESLYKELNTKDTRIAELEGMVRELMRSLNFWYNTFEHATKKDKEHSIILFNRAKNLLNEQ